jgi:hypothetical protein
MGSREGVGEGTRVRGGKSGQYRIKFRAKEPPWLIGQYCENVPTGIFLCCDSAFDHKKEFSIFNSPKGIWRSLAVDFFVNFKHQSELITNHRQCLSLMLRQLFSQFFRPHDFKTPPGDYDNW